MPLVYVRLHIARLDRRDLERLRGNVLERTADWFWRAERGLDNRSRASPTLYRSLTASAGALRISLRGLEISRSSPHAGILVITFSFRPSALCNSLASRWTSSCAPAPVSFFSAYRDQHTDLVASFSVHAENVS